VTSQNTAVKKSRERERGEEEKAVQKGPSLDRESSLSHLLNFLLLLLLLLLRVHNPSSKNRRSEHRAYDKSNLTLMRQSI
jgi:hypothetical protein